VRTDKDLSRQEDPPWECNAATQQSLSDVKPPPVRASVSPPHFCGVADGPERPERGVLCRLRRGDLPTVGLYPSACLQVPAPKLVYCHGASDALTLDSTMARVSHVCACIGSPCLRQCVHGAPIGQDHRPARRRREGAGCHRPLAWRCLGVRRCRGWWAPRRWWRRQLRRRVASVVGHGELAGGLWRASARAVSAGASRGSVASCRPTVGRVLGR
jgi:hypothetical protein